MLGKPTYKEIECSFILLLTCADPSLLYGINKLKSEASTPADPVLHKPGKGPHPLEILTQQGHKAAFEEGVVEAERGELWLSEVTGVP